MISKPNRHGLFKPELSFQVNPEQKDSKGEYVGFKPRSNLRVLQEKSR
jgi:hypothetical protein